MDVCAVNPKIRALSLSCRRARQTSQWRSFRLEEENAHRVVLEVITEPKNALGKQYKKMFQMNDVKLHFTDVALKLIAKKAMARNIGARGLRAIFESMLIDAMYEIPDAKPDNDRIDAVLVDEEAVSCIDNSGYGAKILRGDGSLNSYLSGCRMKYETPNGDNTQAEVDELGISSRAISIW
ncbi:hypothetical protein HPP92_003718 [Vanilla planifolia]|uniref:Clp ATPase C-terminal domain-containing protein n=1 Tax=Vanilla planifolia TaxID=51239 RepID=A0A835VHH0_VANPL|nr:hypothetical protein HPP92_003718 [Vanilla planifolia]